MRLYVKYMVSQSCIMRVREQLKKLGLYFVVIDLGVIDILDSITTEQREQLKVNLNKSGFELLDAERSMLVEKIEKVIIEMIHNSTEEPKINDEEYLSEKLGSDFNILSNVFSEVKGITINQFIIHHRVERVKELIIYNKRSLTEIACLMHYSSVAHLSSQFQEITGLTTSFYKGIAEKRKLKIRGM